MIDYVVKKISFVPVYVEIKGIVYEELKPTKNLVKMDENEAKTLVFLLWNDRLARTSVLVVIILCLFLIVSLRFVSVVHYLIKDILLIACFTCICFIIKGI